MAFFIKNFESITASLIQGVSESTSALTDFNVGSKVRTLLESFAMELEYYYLTMMRGIMEGINAAIYNSFDFPALPPVAASGIVKLSLYVAGTNQALAPTSDITIPQGFRFQIPNDSVANGSASAGTIYYAIAPTTWESGKTTCDVPVACNIAGKSGNTTPNTITSILDSLTSVANGEFRANNPVGFINGDDQEDEVSHKKRFAQYLQSLSRGTLSAIESAALTAIVKDSTGNLIEQVRKAMAVEPYMQDGSLPVGHVDIYIHNGVGGTSAGLVTAAQKIIDGYTDESNNRISGYKAAGIIATVKAATEQPQQFVVRVNWKTGYSLTLDVKNNLIAAIQRYVASLNPGQSIIYNKLIEIAMSVPGIYNCTVESPNGDVAANDLRSIMTVGDIQILDDDNLTVTSETFTT